MENFFSSLAIIANQIYGWKTKRKIVIFESDDWGSIRMPSVHIYDKLTRQGFKLHGHYNKYDSLERTSDLSALFDILSSFIDSKGRYPSLTANYIVANPDFEGIKETDFSKYKYEVFTETYKKQAGCERSFDTAVEGIKMNIFKPQFHGREHINVNLWMKALQEKERDTCVAFENRFWGHRAKFPGTHHKNYLSSFDFQNHRELEDQKTIINEGLELFHTVFGFRSQSFIATNHTWHPELEKTLFECGVRYFQGLRWQLIPREGQIKFARKWRYTGQSNIYNQLQLVRNVFFEPSENPEMDWENISLKEISDAFFWRKPAIISCHRVNFIGAIDSANNSRNLILLKNLIKRITVIWPEVEFMTSDELGNIILQERN